MISSNKNSIEKEACFRFYAELNDFLNKDKKFQTFVYTFSGNPAIKHCIEAIGVPHTEVELILANGISVGFYYQLQNNDFVSIYPVFESFDVSSLLQLRPNPLRKSKFILDVHLGKLAKKLRMLGFDTLYRNNYTDPEIIHISLNEKRIILTHDKGILKAKSVKHGYWIRSSKLEEQIAEVLHRFDLFSQIKAFHRCMVCNGLIHEVEKETVSTLLLPKIKLYYDEFYTCSVCDKIYWKGSHFDRMVAYIQKLSNLSNTQPLQ